MQVRNADPCLGPDLFHLARIWVKLEWLIGENDQAWQILQRPEGRTHFKWNWGLECSWRKMLGVNRAGCWGPAGARSRGVSTGDLLLFPMMWTNHPLFSLIPISFLSSFPAMDDTRIEEFFLSLSLILNSVPTYKCIDIATKVIHQKSSDCWLQLFCHHVYCVKHGVS